MGKRGPRPKQKFEKVLSGKLPLTKDNGSVEEYLHTDPPVAPDHLSPEEIKIWDETIELLRPSCILQHIDVAVLSAYCCNYVRWMDAEKEIRAFVKKGRKFDGLITEGANGQMIVNPLINISRRAQMDMVTYANQMGMTPSARMRIDLKGQKEPENPFALLKKSKNNGELDKNSNKVRRVSKSQKK